MAPTPAKKAPAKKVVAAPAKTAGKAAAKKSTVAKAPSESRGAKPAARKSTAKAPAGKAPAKKAPPATASAPRAKATPAKATKAPPAKAAPAKSSTAKRTAAKTAAPAARPLKDVAAKSSSHFNAAFLAAQRELLMEERSNLLGQAQRLEDEAAELMEDLDPGDVQFDDESGEGDSLVVERERDLALSAQARQTVSDIDAALARIKSGTYGLSVVSGRPIPKERLKAIPWATELVEEKVGGLGSRR